MIGAANVLPIGRPRQETVNRTDFTNTIRQPILNWLNGNPTKRPQYWVLFLDIPSRINAVTNAGVYPADRDNSVSYELYSTSVGIQPFVTHINMGDTNACIGYINKLENIATNYSPGKLIISASSGGYGNTNYYFDDTRFDYASPAPSLGSNALSGVLGVNPAASVTYSNAVEGGLASHVTAGSNVAGYLSWGFHSSLGTFYATDGTVKWTGNTSWYLVETVESFNGQRAGGGGNFIMWFSSNAFGGANYSDTPIGAVTHVDEPGCVCGVQNSAVYFGLWEAKKTFASCAWNSRQTSFFQAVGDPLITK